MKKIMSFLPLVLSMSSFAQAPAPEYVFEKLSETRQRVTIPELSLEDKRTIVGQAKLILKEVFVHRDLKIKNFGPSADPIPALDELEKKIESVSSTQFHKEMLDAFLRLNDWHTTYRLATPYGCYRSMLPAAFKAVKDEFGNEVIAVDSVVTKPEILRLLPADVKFSVGDVLVSYNGLTTAQAISTNILRSMGANPSAKKRDAVSFLSVLSHKYFFFPRENEVAVTLKDKAGNLKSFTVPWITRASKECLNPTVEESGFKGDKDWQREFNQIFKRKGKSKLKAPGDLLDSREPIVKYKMIQNEFGTYAYLRLDSFVPEKLSVNETVLEIERLLEGPLAAGEGLIIDLRDNGGGQILLGEAMVQLLNSRSTVPLNFSLKNSAPNKHLFNVGNFDNRFIVALENADREGLAYTAPIPLNSPQRVNGLGQAFMKPVAIFMNASCYSTCDMISASLQDLGAAIIVGEDPNTGAGGANNWYHSSIIKTLPEDQPGPFKRLPGEFEIGFSFRQTSRTGPNAGELIEDVGVKADMLVPATIEDLGTGNAQLRLITKRLAQETANFRTKVKMIDKPSFDVKIGDRPKLNLKWENMTSLEITAKGLTETIDLENSNPEGREIVFPEDFVSHSPEIVSYEVVGKLDGKRVWRKILSVRSIVDPIELSKDKPILQGFDLDYSPLIIYGYDSAAGWQLKDGQLRIGDSNSNYKSEVESDAVLFAKIKDATVLSFKASVNTEEKFDFLTVTYEVDGVKTKVQELSGNIEMKNYEIPLTGLQGKNVEFHFTFTSDGNIESDGPKIEELVIK